MKVLRWATSGNPLHGVESSTSIRSMLGPKSRIHYMELKENNLANLGECRRWEESITWSWKDISTHPPSSGLALSIESITWSWKGDGPVDGRVKGRIWIHYMELKDHPLSSDGANRLREFITWSWKTTTYVVVVVRSGEWIHYMELKGPRGRQDPRPWEGESITWSWKLLTVTSSISTQLLVNPLHGVESINWAGGGSPLEYMESITWSWKCSLLVGCSNSVHWIHYMELKVQ